MLIKLTMRIVHVLVPKVKKGGLPKFSPKNLQILVF
ncbi:Putative protein [Zobellia galactanivorans]|uniref:Uncharacterized protein n=1 Tax=Zobellia galactanivorans (strain DSM 12802 / CCUG 47099 / CIP 106680 / NCIMB 13871 / Dsij) TaxID=63186 RepID=G0L138_ZOBGA|nr:Putative protein [Zobellia galactanivorans]